MKFNFYFVHGWGLEQNLWSLVEAKVRQDKMCNFSEIIDLNFFSEDLIYRKKIKPSGQKDIFVVHSYGLNWFLKKKIECATLINFFGAPNFINFQKKPYLAKKRISKMIKEFSNNPEEVLKSFYKKCNISFEKKKFINKEKLLSALIELESEDLCDNFHRSSCKIFSIYSQEDKIFSSSDESLRKLKRENHIIRYIKDYDHGFPVNEPYQCYKIIRNIVNGL
jgi:pimeloyl-[acyl-carrier protein] methyl ester esterase